MLCFSKVMTFVPRLLFVLSFFFFFLASMSVIILSGPLDLHLCNVKILHNFANRLASVESVFSFTCIKASVCFELLSISSSVFRLPLVFSPTVCL